MTPHIRRVAELLTGDRRLSTARYRQEIAVLCSKLLTLFVRFGESTLGVGQLGVATLSSTFISVDELRNHPENGQWLSARAVGQAAR